MKGKKLNVEQRCEIERLILGGVKQAEIARLLGVNRSTICCEIKRNSVGGVYRAKVAQQLARERQRNKFKKGKENGEYPY